MQSALDMLVRAGTDRDATTSAGNGPIHPQLAIGWAKSALSRALGLPDQPEPNSP